MKKYLFLYEYPITWLHERLTSKQFQIFSAILVGLTAGLAAVILKVFVHFISRNIEKMGGDDSFFYIFFPGIGITLTVLYIKYFNKGKLAKGLSNLLYSIVKKSSYLPKDLMYSHVITSALTVGFGGSSGLESPIVTTGSAIGSNFGRTYKLTYKERTLLLACGAAAGIAAAFNTPFAGVLFALEVLLVEANIAAFIPVLIAGASGALCSIVILGNNVVLNFRLQEHFDYHNIPFYMILGVLAGFISVYYSKTFLFMESKFKRIENQLVLRILTGSLLLAALIYLFPPLFGEGYDAIRELSLQTPRNIFSHSPLHSLLGNDWVMLVVLGIIVFIKVFATAFTIGGGGNGGSFAPSLFTGAFLGFVFSFLVNKLNLTYLPTSNFTLVAMGGVLSGVFHAPLTGIFLIAEITGGYDLIIPLMMVSALSYAISQHFMPQSMELKKLADKDKIVTTDTDSYILSSIDLEKLLEQDFASIQNNQTLGDLVQVISKSNRNIFPVVDQHNHLKGIVQIDFIRELMFRPDCYEAITVSELMQTPKHTIQMNDDIQMIMKKFDESQLWNLPVLNNKEYIGFISKSSILEKYREILVKNTFN